jgi:hypothetical protein
MRICKWQDGRSEPTIDVIFGCDSPCQTRIKEIASLVESQMLPHKPNYGQPGNRRGRPFRWLLLIPVIYCLSYVGMRIAGRIYPFYNQGSFEMDCKDSVSVVFIPLINTEQMWHNAMTNPPSGA